MRTTTFTVAICCTSHKTPSTFRILWVNQATTSCEYMQLHLMIPSHCVWELSHVFHFAAAPPPHSVLAYVFFCFGFCFTESICNSKILMLVLLFKTIFITMNKCDVYFTLYFVKLKIDLASYTNIRLQLKMLHSMRKKDVCKKIDFGENMFLKVRISLEKATIRILTHAFSHTIYANFCVADTI